MSDIDLRDGELLELAAKAAGYAIHGEDSICRGIWIFKDGRQQFLEEDGSPVSLWNPLEDDGDALRLAARLRLIVDLEDKEISFWSVCKQAYIYISFEDYDYRRAITRAAAEIGRAMT